MSSPRGTTTALGLAIVVVLGGAIAAVATHTSSGGDRVAAKDAPPPSGSPVPVSSATSGFPVPASTPPAALLPTTPAVPTETAPPDADVLTPPATFQWVPDATAGTGAVDAARAAALDGTGTLSKVGFEQLGFVRGVSRQWDDGQNVLVDLVYTFTNSSGAQAYVNSTVAARRTDPQYQAQPVPAGAPPGTVALSNTVQGSTSVVLLYTVGVHAVVLGLVRSGTAPDPAVLGALAALQAQTSATSP